MIKNSIKKIRLLAPALALLLPLLQATGEETTNTDTPLPRVFNYNKTINLFNVNPTTSIPDNKNAHLKKYRLEKENNSTFNPTKNIPSVAQPQKKAPQKKTDTKKHKNWLTPETWNNPENEDSSAKEGLPPTAEEKAETIRQLFLPEDDSLNSEEKSFLSYVQKQHEQEEEKNKTERENDKDAENQHSQDKTEKTFSLHSKESSLNFKPSVSLYSNLDNDENNDNTPSANQQYKPAVEALNTPDQENTLNQEKNEKPLQSLTQNNPTTNTKNQSLPGQTMMNNITSKWLNKQPAIASLPTMKNQLNLPPTTSPTLPPPSKTFTTSTPTFKNSLFSKPLATSPSLGLSNALNRPSATLAKPSTYKPSNYSYKPQRTTTSNITPSSFTKKTNPTIPRYKPARITSGFGNSLPGMSGFSDPMK